VSTLSHTTDPTGSARPAAGDRPAGLVSARLGAWSAITYGVLAMAMGAAQAVRTAPDTSVEIATTMRFMLVLFAVSLLVLVPAQLGLARFARSSLGARLASVGTPLLALGAASSAVNGSDLSWFPAVAVAGNALWFVGTVVLAVSLWRARLLPRWIPLLLPLTIPFTIFLSRIGGGLPAGAFWVAVGVVALSLRLDRD
jgi:hypothetical protein